MQAFETREQHVLIFRTLDNGVMDAVSVPWLVKKMRNNFDRHFKILRNITVIYIYRTKNTATLFSSREALFLGSKSVLIFSDSM